MSFNATRENEILAKISGFTVPHCRATKAKISLTHQGLSCLHTQSVAVDADSDQQLDV